EELKQRNQKLKVRYVIFGGEALQTGKLKEWQKIYPRILLVNMFGITETTVHATYKEIGTTEIEAGISNIGKPIPTLSTYIMDEKQHLLPIGVPGELCIGGEGVTRGYLNRPELTVERFVVNPYKAGERLYKSGDVARLIAGGQMEYLGRIDHQVQIRGFRVELGEIESQLLTHEQIRAAVVIDRSDEEGDHYLYAYIILHSLQPETLLDTPTLQKYLLRRLPGYMIPSYFVQVENIPLTANGKVNRKALDAIGKQLTSGPYTAPQNELEKKIAEAWKEVLHLDKVGIHDSYFELGGTSFDIIKINRKLKELFQIDIPMVNMFRYTTIHTFAASLNKESRDIHDRAAALKRGKLDKKERLQRRKGIS
ncbi:MAG TPA: non-ribosomal peptide synthetase, partial [Candidatus Deferrimicrobium sp.]|nr:non-ribosomal peptide synthetase [Candidatus Deferrimicrobium sp.]